jgi:hypothetical protein
LIGLAGHLEAQHEVLVGDVSSSAEGDRALSGAGGLDLDRVTSAFDPLDLDAGVDVHASEMSWPLRSLGRRYWTSVCWPEIRRFCPGRPRRRRRSSWAG